MDSIPASPGTVNIFVYYGKSDATTTSNGDNTFIFFDDFLGTEVNGTKWVQLIDPYGSISVSNGEIDMKITAGSGWASIYIANTITQTNCVVETKAKGVYDGGAGVQSPYLAIFTHPEGQDATYGASNLYGGNYITRAYKLGPGENWSTDWYYSTTQPQTYKIFQITKNGNVLNAKYLDSDYSQIASSSSRSMASDFSFYVIVHTSGQSECIYDWVRVRNYASPEPTHGAWGSEENVASLIFTHEFASGTHEWDASSELGVELSLNLNNPVSLNMSRTTGGVGGGAPSGLAFLESFVSISINDTTAIQGITITMHYTDQQIAELGLNEGSLAIWYWNESSGNWVELPSTVDTVNNTVIAYSDHLTYFAILGFLIPAGTPISPYLSFLLVYLLAPSGLNPLVYLALGLGLVAVALVAVAVLVLRRRREPEGVPEIEVSLRRWSTPTSESVKCLYCNSEIPKDANFCIFCGRARTRCSVCNTNIVPGDSIVGCPHCGAQGHRDHFLEWIKIRGTCPNCKEKLSRLDVV